MRPGGPFGVLARGSLFFYLSLFLFWLSDLSVCLGFFFTGLFIVSRIHNLEGAGWLDGWMDR